MNLSGPINKVAGITVLGVPAGKGLLFTVAKGLAGALTETINTASKGKIPPYLTGPLLAYGVGKFGPVRNFLGPATEVVQIVAVSEGLEDVAKSVYNMTAKAAGMIGVEIAPLEGTRVGRLPGRIPRVKAPPLAPAGLTGTPRIPLARPAPRLAGAPANRGRAGLAGEGIDEIEARLGPISALNV